MSILGEILDVVNFLLNRVPSTETLQPPSLSLTVNTCPEGEKPFILVTNHGGSEAKNILISVANKQIQFEPFENESPFRLTSLPSGSEKKVHYLSCTDLDRVTIRCSFTDESGEKYAFAEIHEI